MITATKTADKATTIADQALKSLLDQLAAGKSEALTSYLRAMGRFHHYSWCNCMLIVCQKQDATHVAGYRTWQSLGRQVRQGEKGLAIHVPLMFKRDKGTEEEDTIVRFTTGYVFDISQTDGEELPQFASVKGDPGCFLNRLENFASSREIKIGRREGLGAGVKGVSHGGSITLKAYLDPAEEFAVLAHELAHELMHQGIFPRPDRHVMELEAEAVSFVVCAAVGLEIGSAAADYINLYDGDSKLLSESLERIKLCSAELIEHLQ